MQICADQYLSMLDEKLAVSYRCQMEKSLKKDAFRENQVKWIDQVRNSCTDLTCLTEAYETRIEEINTPSDDRWSFVRFDEPENSYIDPDLLPTLSLANDRFKSGGEYLRLDRDHYLLISDRPSELVEIIPSQKKVTPLFKSSTRIFRAELYRSRDRVRLLFATQTVISGLDRTDYYVAGIGPESSGKAKFEWKRVFSLEQIHQTPKYRPIDRSKPMACGTSSTKGASPIEFVDLEDLNNDCVKDLVFSIKAVNCDTGVVKTYQEKMLLKKFDLSLESEN